MAMRPVAVKKLKTAPEAEHLFDTHPEIKLDFERVREALKQGYSKPFLLVDSSLVRTKARRFKAAMPLMSTRCRGRASRNAMVGTRLWPPASTRPSSPATRAKVATASSTVFGAWYWNGAGFIGGPQCRTRGGALQ